MELIEKYKIINGVYWIGVPQANVFVLCACPEEIVKHLMKKGFNKTIQKQGVTYETGPNVILLSDVMIQNGSFSNLAEFSVLQMLYRQGMILPGHPNNTGVKPMLIGSRKQIDSQMKYIYRGNYGLISVDEIVEAGITREKAEELMRLKLKFAFGHIRDSNDLLSSRVVEREPVEIRNGVYARCVGFNRYEFQYKGESESVDLNLLPDEKYDPPYELAFHQLKREYFAAVHSGGGDGWNVHGLSMASIVIFQGKIYLVDAAPNILHFLEALGISVNEVEGLFHTHTHDDHFAGITTLIRADHRIKYFATPLVRKSVTKKLAALLSWDKDYFDRFFEVHDLECDTWNNINGLEVKPTISPHPVETDIFTFRALWKGGYRTYAHFGDIASLKVLQNMITDDTAKPGISREFYNKVQSEYLQPVNIKKIDVGGGMIHGNVEDFKDDTSDKIIFAHTSTKLSIQQKAIGADAPFGSIDVLIHSNQDYTMRYAAQLLRKYFPVAPREDINMLLNCDIESLNAGTILIKKGAVNPFIYFIMTGIVEMVQSESNRRNTLSAGSLVGEFTGILEVPSLETYLAASYVRALKIPSELYYTFIQKNKLYRSMERIMDNRLFLQSTTLFGDMVSYPVQNKVAQAMSIKLYSQGEGLKSDKTQDLYLLYEGELQLCKNTQAVETIKPGGFAGEETILYNVPAVFDTSATKKCKVFHIPKEVLVDIPIVQWKLMETLEKRLEISGSSLSVMGEYTI
ncbi:MAG: cyclic nucleotide-binding domain-containing protein [Planctomycetota bacterium]